MTEERSKEYEKAIEGAREMIVVVDRSYRFVIANRAFVKYMKTNRDHVIGTSVADLLGLDVFESAVKQHLKESFEGATVHLEMQYPHPQNGLCDLAVSYFPIDDPTGVTRVVCVLEDITERRRTEQALHTVEERFKLVVEHIGDAVVIDDVQGHVTFANDKFLSLFGFDRNDLERIRMEDYATAEFCEELRERHRRRMEGESVPTHFEFKARRSDESQIWVEADVVPIKDREGMLVGTQSTLRDVTTRKLAEDALRESEARFRTIANSAPVMIWMSDPAGVLIYMNSRLAEFLGRPKEGDVARLWLDSVHKEDAESYFRQVLERFERREPFKSDVRLRRFDGAYRNIVNTGVPRFNADGTFGGYIGSCVDDTERRAAEEAIRTIGARLIDAQEQERKRIARELHDNVNQRLAMVVFELQRLHDDSHLSATERSEHLHKVCKQTTEISSEIQSLSHKLHSATIEYLGLTHAIQGFCDELSSQQSVMVTFTHEGVPKDLDPDVSLALFRITQEALQNAIKYSGVHTFDVDLRGTRDSIQLAVRDAGVGFGPDVAIFGRGLGLISMRERIVALKGSISIVSKPARGTEITARVPLTPAA